MLLGAIAGSQRFQLTSAEQLPVYNRSYSCTGSESHLRDCPFLEPSRTEPCGYRRNAYIVCQGMAIKSHICYLYLTTDCPRFQNYSSVYQINTALSTLESNCNAGEVRLLDGPNVREGRVEVCINNAWGTICNEQFGVDEAIVTCTQMNFSNEGNCFSATNINCV